MLILSSVKDSIVPSMFFEPGGNQPIHRPPSLGQSVCSNLGSAKAFGLVFSGVIFVTVAMAGATEGFKSLATWRSWWAGKPIARELAESMQMHIDPTKLPGGGRLIVLNVAGKVSQSDLQDHHKCKLAEALLHAYPPDKDPSSYLLGDAVLHLDYMLGNVILGKQSLNPMVEKSRRDNALKDGANLKYLLSYIRNSAGRHEKGRPPEITYLKELVALKGRPRSSSKAGSEKSSPLSPGSSIATTLVLGESNSPSTDAEPATFLV